MFCSLAFVLLLFFSFLTLLLFFFFFFNDTATTEIYTLSLHDALPILIRFDGFEERAEVALAEALVALALDDLEEEDRKSTRLNSSHITISYAVFCLKKKKKQNINDMNQKKDKKYKKDKMIGM